MADQLKSIENYGRGNYCKAREGFGDGIGYGNGDGANGGQGKGIDEASRADFGVGWGGGICNHGDSDTEDGYGKPNDRPA